MPDDPNLHILDRPSVAAAAVQLSPQLSLMEQVVNYGTQLIPRAWTTSAKGLSDSVLIFHLLRKVVLHLDTIHINLSAGACMGAMPSLRAMLEVSVLIDWLLLSDIEQKASFLFIAAWRREKAAAEALIPGSSGYQALVQDLGPDGLAEYATAAQSKASSIQNMGQHAVLGPIYQMFEDVSKAKGKEPVWTDVYEAHRQTASGNPPKSPKKLPSLQIRTIFKEAGRLRDYRLIYGHLSEEGHGSALLSSLEIEGGTSFQVPNIRDWSKFPEVFRFALSFAIRSYQSVLKHYRPGEAHDNFRHKYTNEWSNVFMAPITITKKPELRKM